MGVTFILGRAGTGKTRYCLDALLTELAAPKDERRLVLLVPEQASFEMERALALGTPRGAYWRAEVLSFSRLTERVLDTAGPRPAELTRAACELILRTVVQQRQSTLRELRSAVTATGVFGQLQRLFETLRREAITPEMLHAGAEQLSVPAARRKITELAEIFADYVRHLGPDRIDPAARLTALRERVLEVPWLRGARVWADGFAGFTGAELQTLVALARVVDELYVALLVDPASPTARAVTHTPDPWGLFHRTESTYLRLEREFCAAGVEIRTPISLTPRVPPRFKTAPILADLEQALSRPVTAGAGAAAVSAPTARDGVRLREFGTHREELRAAARWIRASLVDARGALRFRDFALITRNLAPFSALVSEVLTEYEIPHFLDLRRPLRTHPLARLALALLEAAGTDADSRSMVRLLRTRLLPLPRAAAEELENLVTNEVISGLAYWRQPTWELGSATSRLDAHAGARAHIVAALEPLVRLAAAPARGAEWAAALRAALEALEIPQRTSELIAEARRMRQWERAETHRLVWERLCDVVQDLHGAPPSLTLSLADAAAVLKSTFDELTLALAPPTADQVLVSAIDRSRHPEIKHAWIFAFNEGIFPAPPREEALVSAGEREELARAGLSGVSSRQEDAAAERLLAYIALTRPSCSLTVSYAVVGDDGGALLPSPLVSEIARAIPGLAAERGDPCAPPVCVAEAARGYLAARAGPHAAAHAGEYQRLREELRNVPSLSGTVDWHLRGLSYGNAPTAVAAYRRPPAAAAGVSWIGSPSEVETYIQCPFKHFATYGLKLDTRRGPRPLRWDLGEMAHTLLADVMRQAARAHGGVRAVSVERWQALLDESVAAFWRSQPADIATRRPELVHLGELLVRRLRDLLRVHADRWRRGDYDLLDCEWSFPPLQADGAMRGPALRLADGTWAHLRGQIDRVDVCRTTQPPALLVYDYKSSGVGSLRAPFLTGHRLQLFTYLLVLSDGFPGIPDARPAGGLLAPLYPQLDALEARYAAEAPPDEQLLYLYRPRGLVGAEAARRLDRQLGPKRSPVANLVLKKDGDFASNCDAVPADAIRDRVDLARATTAQAVEGISAGVISIAPLVERRRLACQQCDFQTLCRFDPAYNEPRVAEATLPCLDDDIAEDEGDT